MWEAVLVVVLGLVGIGGLVRAQGQWVRWQGRRLLGDAPRLAEARGHTLLVKVGATRVLPGMRPRSTNRSAGDLFLTADRLLVVCNRGVVVDERLGGRGLRSARCPGPGRLVLEGDVASVQGPAGEWRVEVMLGDAPAWAEKLQPFVRPESRGKTGLRPAAPVS